MSGGLDLAVAAHYHAQVAWHAEIEPAACKVLEARWPGAPNLGDVTRTEWAAVPPVDVITAGYPCQPFSHAGNRKGETDDRHLWPYAAAAVRVLRPRIVVLENVSGHLSMGFGRVLGDLAEAGYDAGWVCVPASAAGAPHRRERVFIVARDAHRPVEGAHGEVPQTGAEPGGAGGGRAAAAHPGRGQLPRAAVRRGPGAQPVRGIGPLLPTPCASERGVCRDLDHRIAGGSQLELSDIVQLLPTPTTMDCWEGRDLENQIRTRNSIGLQETARLLPTPKASDGPNGGPGMRNGRGEADALPGIAHFGPYQAACDRWAAIIGRPAPSPSIPGQDGRPRLNPVFVEWMMGLPAGWVTGLPIPRSAQLKALGNGVVPQQAAHALDILDGRTT